MRSAFANPGKFLEGWPFATPPARRAEGEIRAPDTLVEVTSYATADAGSIPAVSTNQDQTKQAIFRGTGPAKALGGLSDDDCFERFASAGKFQCCLSLLKIKSVRDQWQWINLAASDQCEGCAHVRRTGRIASGDREFI